MYRAMNGLIHGTLFRKLYSTKPQLVVLTGNTGVGKTSLALNLAKKINGELISCDSVKVFKNLDIGSNKSALIQETKRIGIPVHMLDLVQPTESPSAGFYVKLARETIEDLYFFLISTMKTR
eukprot:TRINITY_DN8160_c0_g1_i2.p1 TRINITY_DN8160_c0_g1~~TRINITY_DN8160_c0_g1_i2.p1  ORF type:complete len:122 (-),score=17.75 TRINITY_DN8160_c0_g1_i2:574-939(-)